MRIGLAWSIAAAVALVGAPGDAVFAQSLVDEASGLEFRTDLPWARLELAGPEKIRGGSPLRVPGPVYGDFWLKATGPMMEPQQGRVRIHLDESGSRITSFGRPSTRERLLSSLLYPGYAQSRQREQTKSFLMGAAGTIALTWTVWSQTRVWDAQDTVDKIDGLVDEAAGTPAVQDLTELQAVARRELVYTEQRRDLALLSMAGAWGVSLIDALFYSPGFDVSRSSENAIALDMRRKSRTKAMVGSLIFPGIGQQYNGQGTKAVWMACGGALAAGFFLHEQDAYNVAVRDYDVAEGLLGSSGSIGEMSELESKRDEAYQTVENAWRDRNVALGIVAGYWALSGLDALVSFGKPWGGDAPRSSRKSFGLKADPTGRSLAAEVRF